MSKKNDNPRSYNFCGVCYEEHWQGLRKYLIDYVNRGVIKAYYIIMHNPDTIDKARHMHFTIEYYDAHTLTSIDKKISQYCESWRVGLSQYCSDLREYCCYMLHKYEIDKERYYYKNVESNDKARFVMLVTSENNNQIASDKLFLKRAYDLIEKRHDLGFSQIIRLLTFDKEFKASQVNRYNALLWRYFDDNRLQHTLQDHFYNRG